MEMDEKKKVQVEVILDILELKNHNLKTQTLSMQQDLMVQNNIFYTLLDSLISHFMDKYKISYKDLQEGIRKRED
jgi:predicted transcriptional regulator